MIEPGGYTDLRRPDARVQEPDLMAAENDKVQNAVGVVMALALAGGLITLDILDLPPVSWCNQLQASVLGGHYYPKLTFLILLLVGLIPVMLVLAILKAIRGNPAPPDGNKV